MNEKVDEMPLIFIRHKMDSSPEIYQELLRERLIALHYDNIPSADPNHPDRDPKHRPVFKRLRNFCRTGALVAADYSKYPPRRMLVGKIKPNSKPTPRTFKPCEPEKNPKGCVYKVVKLDGVVEFDYAEHRLLEALQPRGGGVIVRWRMGRIEPYLKALYKKRLYGSAVTVTPSVYRLTDSHLEVLCSEYLRTDLAPPEVRIDYLLTPIGRTMKGTDIYGARKQKGKDVIVLAQVTFSTDKKVISEKAKRLREYAEGYQGSKKLVMVYFGPKAGKPARSQLENIEFISIQEVFDKMSESGTGIVEDMLP